MQFLEPALDFLFAAVVPVENRMIFQDYYWPPP